MNRFPRYDPAAIPAIPAIFGASEEEDDPLAGLIPYRLNVDGASRLVWLAPGLTTAQAIIRARAKHPGAAISADPPPGGWPSLADVAKWY